MRHRAAEPESYLDPQVALAAEQVFNTSVNDYEVNLECLYNEVKKYVKRKDLTERPHKINRAYLKSLSDIESACRGLEKSMRSLPPEAYRRQRLIPAIITGVAEAWVAFCFGLWDYSFWPRSSQNS